jgi:hypothetical protein
MHDDGFSYHGSDGFVYIADWAFEIGALWESIDDIERGGIPLDQIGRALSFNWPATVTALALKNLACLYTIIADAARA